MHFATGGHQTFDHSLTLMHQFKQRESSFSHLKVPLGACSWLQAPSPSLEAWKPGIYTHAPLLSADELFSWARFGSPSPEVLSWVASASSMTHQRNRWQAADGHFQDEQGVDCQYYHPESRGFFHDPIYCWACLTWCWACCRDFQRSVSKSWTRESAGVILRHCLCRCLWLV